MTIILFQLIVPGTKNTLSEIGTSTIQHMKAKYRKAFVHETFAPLERKQHTKHTMLHPLHIMVTDRSSVTSDSRESCYFNESGFGVVNLNKNVEDEKVEMKIWKKCQTRQSLSQNLCILMIML